MLGLVPAQLVDADELAVTTGLVTLVFVVRVMCLAVFGKIRRLAEALAADFAFQGLLTCVRPYVHRQGAFLLKGLATTVIGARVGLVTRMCALVLIQRLLRGESLTAGKTLVRLVCLSC